MLDLGMGPDPAFAAYESLAAVYNEFTHTNDYEMWLGRVLLPELEKRGLRSGGSALDVACGTGRAFPPLLRRGWSVEGCDLSPAMLEVAERVAGSEVPLRVADMRELPELGGFDLILCLNDSVNNLLGDDDLVRALRAMRANLAPEGLLVFDVNSRSTYLDHYRSGTASEVENDGSRWVWSGQGEVGPSLFEARIEGDGISPISHVQRFRPAEEVRQAMGTAGLTCLASLGMTEVDGEVRLAEPADEARDYKIVFIGGRAASP
jgi:SAM-dependent methyltransferase